MWCLFQYREFHDVPRSLVVRLPDSVLLLESSFEEGRDDYSDEYELYVLDEGVSLEGSWSGLARDGRRLGSVRVESLEFDETRRRMVDLAPIRSMLEASGLYPPRG